MLKSLAAAVALCGTMFVASASAAPRAPAADLPAVSASDVQYETRTVERRVVRDRYVAPRRVVRTNRVVRPGRVCTVRTIRTRTPRGVIVRKVRSCR